MITFWAFLATIVGDVIVFILVSVAYRKAKENFRLTQQLFDPEWQNALHEIQSEAARNLQQIDKHLIAREKQVRA